MYNKEYSFDFAQDKSLSWLGQGFIAGSSNGRTAPFEGAYERSIRSPAALPLTELHFSDIFI